ncbi:MAG TPA: bacterial transcriptional activator domain-containing protein [Planctomycetota bacterium]|nr:bacterial transcriptional activator domain-containing protein [Planctomycetota bacterium]
MKRGLVPAIPFAVSLSLSLSTIGSNVYWQDSGLFLSAVKDVGILYPPGFVLYVVLCKVWTLLFFFLDFTLAVHLFSSACVAGAASVLAMGVRDLLRSRGSLFRVGTDPETALADWAGIAVGSMAAGGYTLWFTGIYAKGYALYYLILALLLWRMIRADERPTSREFTGVAVLIGLAWAAHPSAVCLALPLVLFVVHHRAAIGGKGLARGVGIAAAAALGPSLILLPLMAMREPATALGDPRSLPELVDYVLGVRFMGRPGAFGFEQERAASVGAYLWEEFLGVGLILFTIGLVSLVRPNPRLLVGLLAWVLPYSAFAILFKVEGQHDCWLVAAWLPLHLLVGVGIGQVGRHLPSRIQAAGVAAMAAAALVWAVGANRADLSQRHYAFADFYGQVLLRNLDPDAILVLNGDDSLAISGYLQRVKGQRSDVTIVAQPFLGLSLVSERDWYDQRLLRERPFLRMPDYAGTRARLPGVRPLAAHLAAFLQANAGRGRAVFTQATLPDSMLPAGTTLVPAGVLWKLVPSDERTVDVAYWRFPVEPEDLQGRVGRSRGIRLVRSGGHLESQAQPYEDRLMELLLKGRVALGDLCLRAGRHVEAARLLHSVRLIDPDYENQPAFVSSLGQAYHAMGDESRAEELFRHALRLGLGPGPRGWVLFYLGEICEKRGRGKDAEAMFVEASIAGGGDPALQERLAMKHASDARKEH